MADLLLANNHKVVGVARRSSTDDRSRYWRVEHILNNPNFTIVEGDIEDAASVYSLLHSHRPDFIYNFAAMSHVGTSFNQPSKAFQSCGGLINILEAVRTVLPTVRLYHASSSEMFGSNFSKVGQFRFQNELTPFAPNSPYAAAKLAAHNMCRIYRDAYNLFVCCGILFNHESPRRGLSFVTRKVTNYVATLGEQTNKLKLGNIDSIRDWGFAGDYCEAIKLMTEAKIPNDYVVGTRKTHSVRDLLREAFRVVGVSNYVDYITTDVGLLRPVEVPYLCGDYSKIELELGWKPKTSFSELIKLMVEADVKEKETIQETRHTA